MDTTMVTTITFITMDMVTTDMDTDTITMVTIMEVIITDTMAVEKSRNNNNTKLLLITTFTCLAAKHSFKFCKYFYNYNKSDLRLLLNTEPETLYEQH